MKFQKNCKYIYFILITIFISTEDLWAKKAIPSDSLLYTQAQFNYQKAMEFRKLNVYDSSNHYFRMASQAYHKLRMYQRYWSMMNDLAYNYTYQGNFTKARQILNKTLDINRNHSKGKNTTSADAYYTLAITYFREKKFDAEILNLQKALAIQQKIYKNTNPKIARTKNTMGIAYSYKKDYNTALRYFLEAKDIREKAYRKYHASLITSYRNIGDTYKKLAQYDNALEYFHKELRQAKRATKGIPHKIWIRTYKSLGDVHFMKREYEQALHFFRKSLQFNQKKYGVNTLPVSSDYNNLGVVYNAMDKYDVAIGFFNKALTIKRKLLESDHPKLAQVYNNLGVAYSKKAMLEKAFECHARALRMRQRQLGANHPQVATSYNNIGEVYLLKGAYDMALESMIKSMQIKQKVYGVDHPETAVSYNNIGSVYDQKGDIQTALEYYTRALEIRKSLFHDKHPDVALLYNRIGMAYYHMKKHDLAIRYYQKAIKIQLEVLEENDLDLARSFNSMGVAQYLKKNYAQSLEYYNKAIKIKEKVLGKTHPSLAQIYGNMGHTYAHTSDRQKAIAYHKKALHLQQTYYGKTHPNIANSYNNLAVNYYHLRQYDKSLKNYHAALIANTRHAESPNVTVTPLSDEYMNNKQAIFAFLGKAEVWLTQHQQKPNQKSLQYAYQHLFSADEIIDQTRNLYVNEADKILLAETVHRMTDLAINVCKELHLYTGNDKYLNDIFFFIEKSKSAILLTSIIAQNFDVLPNELLYKEVHLRERISAYENQLLEKQIGDQILSPKKVVALEKKIFLLKRKYDALVLQFQQRYPKYYNLKYDVQISTIDDVRKKVLKKQPKTAIIQYFIGKNDLIYIGILTAKHYEILTITGSEQMNKAIHGLRNAVKFKANSYPNYASELYQMIVAPIEHYFAKNTLKINQLIIVNDGMTSYLPFEILLSKRVKNIKKINYKRLKYLNKKYAISYVFSVTLMSAKRHTTPFSHHSCIAFAPVFQDSLYQDHNVAPLPATATEVENIRELYQRKKFNVKSVLKKSASENYIKSQLLDKYRYIHLATHGFVNEKDPHKSGILLAKDTSNEDGILYAHEIYNLNLSHTDLVMLSACQTGLGKIVRGEGLIGLTRGFLYAGARNVGVSMWKVADKSTSKLMIQFYKELLKKHSKSRSLQRAKNRLIHSKKYSHPYFWGGFILIGAK